MLGMSIISDFTNVLIDTKDSFIILPKPVTDKTMALSRILHIGIHISKMMFCLAGTSIFYIFFAEGVAAGIVFILEVVIAGFFAVFFVNMLYLLVLRFTTADKFKDSISYIQIGFSILMFGSYYLLPSLFKSSFLEEFNIFDYDVLLIFPPVWIASLHHLAINFSEAVLKDYLLSIVAILSPFVGVYLVVKVLAPGFNKKIAGLQTSSPATQQAEVEVEGKNRLVYKLSNLFAKNTLENAGFRVSWILTSRLREFKVRTYPSFGYLPVYFLFILFTEKGEGTFAENWEKLPEGNMYIFLFYLSNFVLSSVLQNINRTEKFKASWIYHLSPYQAPGRIITGMYKALVIKYYLPLYILICAFSISIWGFGIVNDMIVALFFSLIFGVITSLFLVKDLPFSQPPSTSQPGKYIVNFLIILLPLGFGFLHNGVLKWELLIWIMCVILPVAFFFLIYFYQRVTWNTFKDEDF